MSSNSGRSSAHQNSTSGSRKQNPDDNGEAARKHFKETVAKSLQNYQIGDMLGQGAFGQVFLAHHPETKRLVALKVMERLDSEGRLLSAPPQEALIHSRLVHPSIVGLGDIFGDEYHIYLVIEYMEKGSLHRLLQKNGSLDEAASKRVLRQVAAGLGHMHSLSLIHRDIKPADILINHEGLVKLADFNAACEMKTGVEIREDIGTMPYKAPEVAARKAYGYPADCWSLGVVLLEMTSYPLPEEAGTCPADEMQGFISANCSLHLRDLLVGLLQLEPSSRLAAVDVLRHPFLTIE